jgi:hypothetical protein
MSRRKNRDGRDLLFPDVAVIMCMPCSFKISSPLRELVSRIVRDVVKAFVRGSRLFLRGERAYSAWSVVNLLRWTVT